MGFFILTQDFKNYSWKSLGMSSLQTHLRQHGKLQLSPGPWPPANFLMESINHRLYNSDSNTNHRDRIQFINSFFEFYFFFFNENFIIFFLLSIRIASFLHGNSGFFIFTWDCLGVGT